MSAQHPNLLIIWEKCSFMWVYERQNFIFTTVPRDNEYSLSYPRGGKGAGAWLSLDQSGAPARVWNIKWHKDDTIYNSGMAGTAVSNDSRSSPQQQPCPVVVASVQRQRCLNQTFPVLTLVMIPNAGLPWFLPVLWDQLAFSLILEVTWSLKHLLCLGKWKSVNPVWHFATPWTAVHEAPLSMEFSRQEY